MTRRPHLSPADRRLIRRYEAAFRRWLGLTQYDAIFRGVHDTDGNSGNIDYLRQLWGSR